MNEKSPLQDKTILAVDDEPDILEAINEELDMCRVVKMTAYDKALEYLKENRVDMAILDIMGVNGLELLKHAVERNIPSVMLTAHALSMDTLKKSIDIGARAYIPKEKIPELVPILEDVVTMEHRDAWERLFDRVGEIFNVTFGSDWKKHIIEVGPLVVPK